MSTLSVTAVIVNYQTPDLVERAVTSLRKHYPLLPLLLIDNGSRDASRESLARLRESAPHQTDLLLNDRNLHHGPAMDQALRTLQAESVFFLDSDCEILRAGFLELMQDALAQDPGNYIVGKRVWMNKRGFDVSPDHGDAVPYIRPVGMLIRRRTYLTLPPFRRHGTPCLENMREAAHRGHQLVDFPVEEYVRHDGRGTAGRYGYGLGLRGKLNYLFNKLGI
jgi:GT2 family glycosyltransferase